MRLRSPAHPSQMSLGRYYDRRDILALDPQAFFMLLGPEPFSPPENVEVPGATIVTVRGPLDRLASGECDSYEGIAARFDEAFAASQPIVVMRLDSPGGQAAGVFDCSRALRARAAAAGKRLVAYVEHLALSAGYALASACDEIVMSESALAGSIGVIQARPDWSEHNAAIGLRVAFIASGARKADGSPDKALSDAELADTQGLIDAMAELFFGLVGEHRPGLAADKVRKLEARQMGAAAALAAGLVDRIESFETFLAAVARPASPETMQGNETMGMKELRASLAKLAENDDDDGKAAKRALAAMDAEGDEGGEGGEKKKDGDGDGDEGGDAEGDDDAGGDAEGDDDKGGDAGATGAGAQARAAGGDKVLAAVTRLERRIDSNERAQLIATRPDLDASTVATLQKAPLATVRDLVKSLPRGQAKAAPITTVAATRGAEQIDAAGEHKLPADQKRALDIRMGLTATGPGVVNTPTKLTLGAPVPLTPKPAPAAK